MKSVLIIASTLMALSAEGKTTGPADSLKISKDISLDEVVVTATKSSQRDTGCLQRTDKGRAESPERRTRHPLPDPPIAVRDHDVRCRDRYRLFRFPHPGDGCQPYQHHSQRSTGKRLRVTHGLLGEHARLCLFGR